MPLPTWLVNAESDDSLTYWKQVNRADNADASVTALGKRSGERAGIQPEGGHLGHQYAGRISKVVDLGDRRRHGLL